MSEQRSATIIAFPRMKAAPAPPAPVSDPQARLQRALVALEQALAEQRAAILAWQQSLGVLRTSMQGLGQSLSACNARLDALAHDGATGDA